MPACHFVGGNYWILKTTYQNRGVGIHVFRTLDQLAKILQGYINSSKEENSQYAAVQSILRPSTTLHKDNFFLQPAHVSKNMSFII